MNDLEKFAANLNSVVQSNQSLQAENLRLKFYLSLAIRQAGYTLPWKAVDEIITSELLQETIKSGNLAIVVGETGINLVWTEGFALGTKLNSDEDLIKKLIPA